MIESSRALSIMYGMDMVIDPSFISRPGEMLFVRIRHTTCLCSRHSLSCVGCTTLTHTPTYAHEVLRHDIQRSHAHSISSQIAPHWHGQLDPCPWDFEVLVANFAPVIHRFQGGTAHWLSAVTNPNSRVEVIVDQSRNDKPCCSKNVCSVGLAPGRVHDNCVKSVVVSVMIMLQK